MERFFGERGFAPKIDSENGSAMPVLVLVLLKPTKVETGAPTGRSMKSTTKVVPRYASSRSRVVSDGTRNFYTRDGAFDIDVEGTLVNPVTGLTVMGWVADATGAVDTESPLQPLQIPVGTRISAQATQDLTLPAPKAGMVMAGNLDAGTPTVAPDNEITTTVTASASSAPRTTSAAPTTARTTSAPPTSASTAPRSSATSQAATQQPTATDSTTTDRSQGPGRGDGRETPGEGLPEVNA